MRSPLAWWSAARRPPALCSACGEPPTHADPTCDHALTHGDRLRWVRAPWHDGLLDSLFDLVFALGLVAVLVGFGPLLWWLAYGWPPTGWLEIFGALCIALVTLPGAVVSVGILLSLPDLRRGRRWDVVDTQARPDDAVHGSVWMRRGRPHHGGVTRHVVTPLAAPTHSELTSLHAAAATDDPAEIVVGAVIGLAARGELVFTRTVTTGWSQHPPHAPHRIRDHGLTIAASTAAAPDLPWLERLILGHATPHPTPIQRPAAELARALALEVGFQDPDDSGPMRWTESTAPGAALRDLLLDGASPDPAVFPAALAAWRTRDPEGAEAVIQTITAAISATSSPDDDITPPHS